MINIFKIGIFKSIFADMLSLVKDQENNNSLFADFFPKNVG